MTLLEWEACRYRSFQSTYQILGVLVPTLPELSFLRTKVSFWTGVSREEYALSRSDRSSLFSCWTGHFALHTVEEDTDARSSRAAVEVPIGALRTDALDEEDEDTGHQGQVVVRRVRKRYQGSEGSHGKEEEAAVSCQR